MHDLNPINYKNYSTLNAMVKIFEFLKTFFEFVNNM
jgi:hypothetical protein